MSEVVHWCCVFGLGVQLPSLLRVSIVQGSVSTLTSRVISPVAVALLLKVMLELFTIVNKQNAQELYIRGRVPKHRT